MRGPRSSRHADPIAYGNGQPVIHVPSSNGVIRYVRPDPPAKYNQSRNSNSRVKNEQQSDTSESWTDPQHSQRTEPAPVRDQHQHHSEIDDTHDRQRRQDLPPDYSPQNFQSSTVHHYSGTAAQLPSDGSLNNQRLRYTPDNPYPEINFDQSSAFSQVNQNPIQGLPQLYHNGEMQQVEERSQISQNTQQNPDHSDGSLAFQPTAGPLYEIRQLQQNSSPPYADPQMQQLIVPLQHDRSIQSQTSQTDRDLTYQTASEYPYRNFEQMPAESSQSYNGPQMRQQGQSRLQRKQPPPAHLREEAILERERKLHETERKLLEKSLKEANDKLHKLRQDYGTLNRANENLQKEKTNLESKIKDLNSSNDSYKNRNISLVQENKQLSETLQGVRAERTQLQTQLDRNVIQHQTDQTEIIYLRDEGKKLDALNNGLEAEVTKLNAEIVGLRFDNEDLRRYIVKMENNLQPVQDEEYYIRMFEEIRSEVENWVAKQGKSNAGPALSPSDEGKLFKILSGLGSTGRKSAEFLSQNSFCTVWYANTRSRIQLLRHIVAIFLFEKIFKPFAAGLPTKFSEALFWIGDDVISRGSSLWEWN
jgi:predicted  nucleic acid-binding Zn-ribbon protein